MFCVYKFLNKEKQTIYVGLTGSIDNRINGQHFGGYGHLSNACYEETCSVVYSECVSQDDAKIKERYLINKLSPKYNDTHNNGSKFSFEININDWKQIPINMLDKKNKEIVVQGESDIQNTNMEYKPKKRFLMSKLEVWVDADFIGMKVGTLTHDRGSVRFNYDRGWLDHPQYFSIDPDLSQDGSVFHPNPAIGDFGIFMDSSPDRWGQTLMKRREVLEAKDQKRQPKNLYAWNFLIGAQDFTRQGALRFKLEGTDAFLSDHKLPAPPLTKLKELEFIAKELSSKRFDDLDALSLLVAAGASLGGTRPKVNFTESDGSIWIAKFPAKDDDRDIGAWEGITHQLAVAAKINVPKAKIIKLSGEHHTFCVKRFDRYDNKRVFYASAMTMLKKSESDGSSYLDIAQCLMTIRSKSNIDSDLDQLFRRVAFNVAVGNKDDHLRNHGFVLSESGWQLSPAFDINPNIDKAEHVLNIDDCDNRPSMDTVLTTADMYELTQSKAEQIIEDVVNVVKDWRLVAKRVSVSKAEIELMESAFLQYEHPSGRPGW